MPHLIELAIPALVLLMAVEAIADAIMRRELHEIKDSAASITMGLGNVAVSLLTKTMQFGALQLALPLPGFQPGLPVLGLAAFVFWG